MRHTVIFLLLLTALLHTTYADAQEPGPTKPAPKEAEPERTLSVTAAPILLLAPVLEVTVEYRLSENISTSSNIGYGRVSEESSAFGVTVTDEFEVFIAGASIRYYAAGSFESGMQIGLAAEYIDISPQQDTSVTALKINSVTGGLLVSPFIGYKIISDAGFTFDSQFGPSYLALDTDPQDLEGTDSEVSSPWQFMINLQLGWSF